METVRCRTYRRMGAGGIALLVSLIWTWAALGAQATVRVMDLNVRSGPDVRQKVLYRLPKHSRIAVLERSGGWIKIEHQGRQGYVMDRPELVALEKARPVPQGGSTSAGAAQPALKELYRKAETLQRKVKTSQSAMDEIARREKGLLDELNSAEQALDEARRQVRSARAEHQELHNRVAALEQDHARLSKETATAELYASRRLVALYKLGWIGRVELLASAPSFYEFISRRAALERILAQDQARLEKLHNDQAALALLIEQLSAAKTEKQAAQVALDRRIEQLGAEQARRASLLASIRGRKEMELATLQALRRAAQDLDRTIEGLEIEPPRRAAPAASHNAWTDSSKGLLGWPVRGKIISFFGPYRDEKTNLVNFRSGIDIQAERGEPVRAVCDGQTIYAGWFKGFGNMMIVDHGNHYYTVYAHLEEVFKAKGDRVEKGEVIATVGDSGSLSGPALHFEVRHHGKAVDPLQWMNKG